MKLHGPLYVILAEILKTVQLLVTYLFIIYLLAITREGNVQVHN